MIVNPLFSIIYYFPYSIHNFYRVFEIVILRLISKFEPINCLVRDLENFHLHARSADILILMNRSICFQICFKLYQ